MRTRRPRSSFREQSGRRTVAATFRTSSVQSSAPPSGKALSNPWTASGPSRTTRMPMWISRPASSFSSQRMLWQETSARRSSSSNTEVWNPSRSSSCRWRPRCSSTTWRLRVPRRMGAFPSRHPTMMMMTMMMMTTAMRS